MRRRAQPKSGSAGVSLFPFLAVLLCTMGALIVVLVVIARQARQQLDQDDAPVADAAQQKEWETKQADLEWRIEQLRTARESTLAQLETQRQELSHLEDHARRLRGQLEELDNARQELEKLGSGERVERDRLKQEIADAEAKIAEKQSEIDEARRKAGRGGGSYAVVPYHGPNETRRRPIYIECRGDGVVFQPEGLVLTEKDFEGDLGPGNPLASALRAARETMGRRQTPGDGAPYPLLLIRPDGISAYECVLAAMNSWGSEFGYELIGQDWPLEFPPPDPQLAVAMRQAIGEGRLRQSYLARAAPRLMQAGQHATFRASPTGGLMRDDGMPLGRSPQLGSKSRGIGRPSYGRGGSGLGGGSGRDRVAGSSSAGDASGATAKKPGGNPYRAALASQGQSTGLGGIGTGAGGAGNGLGSMIGSPVASSSGGDSLLGLGSSGGEGLYGSNATGGRYGREGLGGGTGGGTTSTGSLLGNGGGGSAKPASNLQASRTGNSRARSPRDVGGVGSGHATGAQGGAAPGVGTGTSTGGGRGWGMAKGKVAASAGAARERGAGTGGDSAAGTGAAGAAAAGSASGGKQSGAAQRGDSQTAAGQTAAGEGGGAGKSAASEGPLLTSAASGMAPANAGAATAGGSSPDGTSATGSPLATGDSVAQSNSAGGGRSAKTGNGKGASGGNGSSATGSANGGTAAASAGGGGGSGGPQQPGAAGVPGIPNLTFGQQPQSIADQRGERNWANPAANHFSFPVTRPIKVVCDVEHLTMLPEGRSRRGYKVIELNSSAEDGVHELVDSVWDRVETWGAAGQGMYWRPELLMEIEPGGERRFAQLQALLADSGLDVRGRPRRSPTIKYPRTKTPN